MGPLAHAGRLKGLSPGLCPGLCFSGWMEKQILVEVPMPSTGCPIHSSWGHEKPFTWPSSPVWDTACSHPAFLDVLDPFLPGHPGQSVILAPRNLFKSPSQHRDLLEGYLPGAVKCPPCHSHDEMSAGWG